MKKLIYLLIVLVIIFGGAYLYQQKVQAPVTTPAPSTSPDKVSTTGWQTYKNDLNGLEIQYPSAWRECEKGEMFSDPTYLAARGPVLGCLINASGGHLTFTEDTNLSANYKSLGTLKDFFVKNPTYEVTADPMPPYSIKDGKTNDGLAYLAFPEGGYYFVVGGKVIRIGILPAGITKQEVEKMISTFRFTK